MAGKDYYQILGLKKDATASEIKAAYRKLALNYHPDRNPGDKSAEDRFKEISEAYGVLMDKNKRARYDFRYRGYGDQRFRYTQRDIFQDMFKDPNASEVFRELSREFDRFGFRFDQDFVNQVFFGGRGFFFGGIFFGGPLFGRKDSPTNRAFEWSRRESVRGKESPQVIKHRGMLAKIGQQITQCFLRPASRDQSKGPNIEYSISISPEEASKGTKIKVAYPREGKHERLSVTVPPGVKTGTRLRLARKGLKGGNGTLPGDLYLRINVAK